MKSEEIRLECLKLAHRPDWSVERVISQAATYEKFVAGSEEKKSQNENHKPPVQPVGKKSGKPDPLS